MTDHQRRRGGGRAGNAARRGLAAIDVSDPASPEEIAFLWMRNTRRGDWEAEPDGGARRPPWRDHCGGPGPRPLASEGRLAVMGVGRDLLVLDLSDPSEPALVGTVGLREQVRALRIYAHRVYETSKVRRETGQVVDLTRPDDPVVTGEHRVVDWVRGAVAEEGWAYRLTARGVEVAEVGVEP